MKGIFKRKPGNCATLVLMIAICIAVNVGLAYATYISGLPMYLDTAGTIAVSMLGGVFPGLLVAVATNLLCGFFNTNSLYYTFIGVAIVMITVSVTNRNSGKRKRDIIPLILYLAVVSGVLGTLFQWILLGGPQFVMLPRQRGS